MATNATTTIRPRPRFGGVEELVVIGIEAVAEGVDEGRPGLVVGGVVLLLLVVAGVVGAWMWRARHRTPQPEPQPPAPEAEVEMTTFSITTVDSSGYLSTEV